MSSPAVEASHSHVHRQQSIFAQRPVVTGVAVALIAGIYFGFAVMNGSPRDQLVEFNVTGLFALAGLLGLLLWPVLLPIAYFGHALWDFAHHNRLRLALVRIPSWYPPWCVVIDVIVGIGLLAIWRAHGLL